MSTQTATDIAALVGEMEDVPCEHSQHGKNHGFADQPASHYVNFTCPCGQSTTYAACPELVRLANSAGRMRCTKCGHAGPAWMRCKILGPVNK